MSGTTTDSSSSTSNAVAMTTFFNSPSRIRSVTWRICEHHSSRAVTGWVDSIPGESLRGRMVGRVSISARVSASTSVGAFLGRLTGGDGEPRSRFRPRQLDAWKNELRPGKPVPRRRRFVFRVERKSTEQTGTGRIRSVVPRHGLEEFRGVLPNFVESTLAVRGETRGCAACGDFEAIGRRPVETWCRPPARNERNETSGTLHVRVTSGEPADS